MKVSDLAPHFRELSQAKPGHVACRKTAILDCLGKLLSQGCDEIVGVGILNSLPNDADERKALLEGLGLHLDLAQEETIAAWQQNRDSQFGYLTLFNRVTRSEVEELVTEAVAHICQERSTPDL